MAKGTKVQVKVSDPTPVEEIKEGTTFDEMLGKASITFQGHPADTSDEDEGKVKDDEKEDLETAESGKKDKETKPPEEKVIPLTEKPPKTPKEEGKTEKTPDEKLAELQKENEILQKRLTDTQSEFHSNREDNKRQREQNEKLAGQIQELMVLTAKRNLEPATPKKSPETELEESVSKTLDEIENLDPTSADYRAKSVKAWSGVLNKMRSIVSEEFESKLTSTKTELTKQQEDQRKRDQEAEEERSRAAQVTSYADSKATELGLDMRTSIESTDANGKKVRENSSDYDLFWKFAGYAPGETTDKKIEWTVNEVQKMKARIAGPIASAKERAEKTQKNNSVLERSGNRPAEVIQQEKPMSMDEALEKAQRTF